MWLFQGACTCLTFSFAEMYNCSTGLSDSRLLTLFNTVNCYFDRINIINCISQFLCCSSGTSVSLDIKNALFINTSLSSALPQGSSNFLSVTQSYSTKVITGLSLEVGTDPIYVPFKTYKCSIGLCKSHSFGNAMCTSNLQRLIYYFIILIV